MTRRIASGSAYEDRIGYSRAVVDADGWVFVSGCTGVDPATMTLPERVEDQCAAALATIARALADAGAGFADVRRVRYILPDRDDFAPCWPHLRAAFGPAQPAATMIVAGLIDPRMRIEIEVTARKSNSLPRDSGDPSPAVLGDGSPLSRG